MEGKTWPYLENMNYGMISACFNMFQTIQMQVAHHGHQMISVAGPTLSGRMTVPVEAQLSGLRIRNTMAVLFKS